MPSIYKLKNLIMNSPDLSDVLDYFLRLSEEGNIIPSSIPFNEQDADQNDTVSILTQVVKKIAGDFLKRAIHVSHSMLCFVEKENFYHGVLISPDIPIPLSVFYFKDINKGFFALSGISKSTEMFRLSLMISDKPPILYQSNQRH